MNCSIILVFCSPTRSRNKNIYRYRGVRLVNQLHLVSGIEWLTHSQEINYSFQNWNWKDVFPMRLDPGAVPSEPPHTSCGGRKVNGRATSRPPLADPLYFFLPVGVRWLVSATVMLSIRRARNGSICVKCSYCWAAYTVPFLLVVVVQLLLSASVITTVNSCSSYSLPPPRLCAVDRSLLCTRIFQAKYNLMVYHLDVPRADGTAY